VYFQQQLSFVLKLTEICEKLRFVPKEARKRELRVEMAALTIPPLVYLPLNR